MNDQVYLDKCIKKAYRINNKFFGFDINIKTKLVYTRKEMNNEWGGKTNNYFVAFVKKNTIVIFGKSVIEKLTSHSLNTYQDIITHEMSHLFYRNMVKTYKPSWIFEGLALNIQKNYKVMTKQINKKHLLYTNRKIILLGFKKNNSKFYWEYTNKFYQTSYMATKKILRILGKEKFLDLLQQYSKMPTKQTYLSLFGKYLEKICT